jgi:hypothetical protein
MPLLLLMMPWTLVINHQNLSLSHTKKLIQDMSNQLQNTQVYLMLTAPKSHHFLPWKQ